MVPCVNSRSEHVPHDRPWAAYNKDARLGTKRNPRQSVRFDPDSRKMVRVCLTATPLGRPAILPSGRNTVICSCDMALQCKPFFWKVSSGVFIERVKNRPLGDKKRSVVENNRNNIIIVEPFFFVRCVRFSRIIFINNNTTWLSSSWCVEACLS